ncbi:MAG: DnaA/Hda family protein [Gammaproteobacteria bacterium]|nr:DnaA/Hda family protein [Gammaproteobacteria bacterium]
MSDKSELWARCQQQFKKRFNADEYDNWIKPLRADFRGDVLLISSTNGWAGRTVQDTFGEAIRTVVHNQLGSASIKIEFSNKRSQPIGEPLRTNRRASRPHKSSQPDLDKQFTFDQFVTGSAKGVEKAVALDVANSFNDDLMVLVIYGDSGMGKTHLLHAIGHHIYEKFPDKAIALTHSTSLVNEVTSILAKTGPQNRNINAAMRSLQDKYSQHDVILLDDLHRLVGKKKIQEEFLHLLNIWHKQHTKLAFTSLGPLADLERLDPALRSRLLGGISIHAVEPDEDAKVQILLQHAAREDVNLPQNVAQYLAQQLAGDIRILKGTLLSIVKAEKHSGGRLRSISEESVDRALRNMNRARKPVTPERVLDLVSERFNISVNDIKGGARVHSKLIPRQMGMLLTHEFTSLPHTEIATAFGRKDHSTVKNALSAIERKMNSDAQLRRDYDWLRHELKK